MTLETSKNLGGIGAILIFIGVIPWIAPYGGILALVGLILALIGFKGLADYYKEAGIFNNALYAVIAAIVGGVAVAAIAFIGLVGFFSDLGITLSDWTNAAAFSSINPTAISLNVITDFLAYIAIAIVIAFVFLIITAFLLRKSLGLLSSKTGVGLFGTTGLIILIGAVLTIVLIGVILVWIAMLLMAVAFFQIRPQAPQSTPT